MASARPTVGVLAMQGAFREHLRALERAGAIAVEVRTEAELDQCDALVLPGGESTAIRKQLVNSGLYAQVGERLRDGMPAFGTCAGLIVLADAPADGAPACYGLLDVDVERNGFGRQPSSFEGPVELQVGREQGGGQAGRRVGEEPAGRPDEPRSREVPGVFIRAPRIRSVGPQVEVIGRLVAGTQAGEPVAVRQGALVGCTFHPELTDDLALHELLVSICAEKEDPVGRPQ